MLQSFLWGHESRSHNICDEAPYCFADVHCKRSAAQSSQHFVEVFTTGKLDVRADGLGLPFVVKCLRLLQRILVLQRALARHHPRKCCHIDIAEVFVLGAAFYAEVRVVILRQHSSSNRRRAREGLAPVEEVNLKLVVFVHVHDD